MMMVNRAGETFASLELSRQVGRAVCGTQLHEPKPQSTPPQ